MIKWWYGFPPHSSVLKHSLMSLLAPSTSHLASNHHSVSLFIKTNKFSSGLQHTNLTSVQPFLFPFKQELTLVRILCFLGNVLQPLPYSIPIASTNPQKVGMLLALKFFIDKYLNIHDPNIQVVIHIFQFLQTLLQAYPFDIPQFHWYDHPTLGIAFDLDKGWSQRQLVDFRTCVTILPSNLPTRFWNDGRHTIHYKSLNNWLNTSNPIQRVHCPQAHFNWFEKLLTNFSLPQAYYTLGSNIVNTLCNVRKYDYKFGN